MIVTNEQVTVYMLPRQGQVVKPHQLPSLNVGNEIHWSHPDDQYTVVFKRDTHELTGSWYDWSEEADDWVDTDAMSDEDLKGMVEARSFLIV